MIIYIYSVLVILLFLFQKILLLKCGDSICVYSASILLVCIITKNE